MPSVLPLLAFLSLAYALSLNNPGRPPRPLVPVVSAPDSLALHAFRLPHSDEVHPPLRTTYYFDQYINHNDTTMGTFKQRYWVSWEFYAPGGPMILTTPGEENAAPFTGYITNRTINGQIAQQQKGATILIEHRFYGLSNPYPDLSVASFKYHTIDQAINDLAFFAKNVTLPFLGGDKVSPAYAPWVLIGGSYAGALTAFTLHQHPDVFWAGYASSAVVQSIVNFWQYFEPERQFMPQNCSNDIQRVVAHWDEIIDSGNETAFNGLKASFGLSDVIHADDVVNTLSFPLSDWQKLSPSSGGGTFYVFCDALEVLNGTSVPGASGRGLRHALAAWAKYSKDTLSKRCGVQNLEDCLGTYNTNQSYWTSTDVDNSDRSWLWTVCTEMGFFQESAPYGRPTLVSRLLDVTYDERQCRQMFPEAFPRPSAPNTDATNKAYGGYHLQAKRLFTANGRRDPWVYATVSAADIHVKNTPEQPIVESDGFHCSDMGTTNGLLDPTVLKVQTQALWYMKRWLASWEHRDIP